MKNVSIVMTLAVVAMSSALPAQSWKNALHEAKEKAKQATNKASLPNSTEDSTSPKSITSPSNASSSVSQPSSSRPGTIQSAFQFCETGATAKNGARTMYVSDIFSGPTDKASQNQNIIGFREYVKQKFEQQQTFNTMCRFSFANSPSATEARTQRLAQLKSSRMSDPVVQADWTPAIESSMIAAAASSSAPISSSAGVMPSRFHSADDAYVPIKPLVFNTSVEGSVRATNYRQALIILKQHPDEIDEVAPAVTTRVLGMETSMRSDLENLQRRGNGTVNQFYSLDWSELMKSNPALAGGPLIDVYLRPDADWAFLKQQPGWNDQQPAWVGVFLYPPSAEQSGRDQRFAAHEVLPITKQQLKDAAARESIDLFYDVSLGFAHYDMDAQAIKFAFPFAAPLETLSYQKCFRLPTSGGEFQRPVGGIGRAGFSELATWRDTLGNEISVECLILDHAPSLPASIPVDIKTAEATNITHGQLTARVFVTLPRSQVVIAKGGSNRVNTYMLNGQVKKLEVLSPNGVILTSITGSSMPAPEAAVIPPDVPKQPVSKSHPAAFPGHH